MLCEQRFPRNHPYKHAVRDFKKEIKAERKRIENTDYIFIEEEKIKDRAKVDGIVFAKVFFEKYYKRYLHWLKEGGTDE